MRPLAFIGFSLAAACGDPSPPPPGYVERDSAGVRIVEHPASDTSSRVWTVKAIPRVSIGGQAGEKWEALHRIEFVAKLATGDIAVSNHATAEVFIYDSAGTYKQSIGRAGKGPGEFGAPTWVGLQRDSIVVLDDMYPSKVSVFDSKGVFVRNTPVSSRRELGEAAVYGAFADDTFLLMGRGGRCAEQPAPPGFHWTCVRLYTANHRTGETSEIPGAFPASLGNGTPLMLRSSARFAAHRNHFVMSMTRPYEVRRYHRSGKLEWVARIERPLRPVTEIMIDAYKEEVIKARSGYSAAMVAEMERRIGGPLQFPDSLSTYDDIIATEDGGAWARMHSYPPDSAPLWDVFDARGIHNGVVSLPARFRPWQVGADYVIGVWRDSLDVEHVQLLDLVRPKKP